MGLHGVFVRLACNPLQFCLSIEERPYKLDAQVQLARHVFNLVPRNIANAKISGYHAGGKKWFSCKFQLSLRDGTVGRMDYVVLSYFLNKIYGKELKKADVCIFGQKYQFQSLETITTTIIHSIDVIPTL